VQVDSETADVLRHEPIGLDAKGHRYFFLSDDNEDTRLYREWQPGKKQREEDVALWQTVAISLEELSDFAARLGASRNRNDKALHDLLTTELLPRLIDSVPARRKVTERWEALEAMPKKRSSRLQVGWPAALRCWLQPSQGCWEARQPL
jgi:hypothetical protein